MNVALYVVGIVALAAWVLGLLAYRAACAADHPGDDFGSGMIAWLLIGIAFLFSVAWVILLAVKAMS